MMGVRNPLLASLVLDAPLTQSINALVGTNPTFTRSTKKWVVPDGETELTEVAINAGGFSSGGLTIEPTATNTALGDVAQWSASNGGAVANDGTLGPDGVTQAIKFTVGNPDSAAYTLLGGSELSAGCWVRAGSQQNVSVAVVDGGLSPIGFATAVCDAGGEWQFLRFDISGTPFALFVVTGDGATQTNGDTMYFCFPQAHDSVHCGTTIITTDASVQRTLDKLSILNANMPDPHVAHTIAFDLMMNHMHQTAVIFEGVSETPKRSLYVYDDGTIEIEYGAGISAISSAGLIQEGVGYRVVITCSGTTFKLYVDGVLIDSNTAGAGSTGGNLVFGEQGNSYFTMSNLRIYSVEATAAQVPYI
jgi:hypothetical protein